jgi:hypothetical protein
LGLRERRDDLASFLERSRLRERLRDALRRSRLPLRSRLLCLSLVLGDPMVTAPPDPALPLRAGRRMWDAE